MVKSNVELHDPREESCTICRLYYLLYQEPFEVEIFLFARPRLEYAFKIWSFCTKSPVVKSSSTKCYKNRQKNPEFHSHTRKQKRTFDCYKNSGSMQRSLQFITILSHLSSISC